MPKRLLTANRVASPLKHTHLMIRTHLQFISPRFMLFLSLGSKHGGVNLLLLSHTRIYGKNVILFKWGKRKQTERDNFGQCATHFGCDHFQVVLQEKYK